MDITLVFFVCFVNFNYMKEENVSLKTALLNRRAKRAMKSNPGNLLRQQTTLKA